MSAKLFRAKSRCLREINLFIPASSPFTRAKNVSAFEFRNQFRVGGSCHAVIDPSTVMECIAARAAPPLAVTSLAKLRRLHLERGGSRGRPFGHNAAGGHGSHVIGNLEQARSVRGKIRWSCRSAFAAEERP